MVGNQGVWYTEPRVSCEVQWGYVFQSRRALFDLGRVVATPSALASIDQDSIRGALGRHVSGDWGDCDAHDRQENATALREGRRILSAYHDAKGTKFWIITEWDRSLTNVELHICQEMLSPSKC